MKILIIGHAYIVPINRIKWQELARKYDDLELKVIIPEKWPAALFEHFADDLQSFNIKNLEFIKLKTYNPGNEVLYRYSFIDLFKIIKKFRPDLIHVEQGDNALSYFQSIFISKLLFLKTKFTFFTWVNWKFKKSLKYKLTLNLIEKFNLKLSSGAFVGNLQALDILKDKNFKKPMIELLQLGVDQNIFKPNLDKRLSEKFNIGFIGRIVEEKGVKILLNTFNNLIKNKNYDNWNLIFIGDGKSKQELISFVEKNNLQKRVIFQASLAHELIADQIKQLDILILPSYDTLDWKEQFGHVLIEAMACCVPVIGSNAGYIAQVIKDGGLVFEQKDEESLLECLNKLMSDQDLREKIGKKGFDVFQSNYSYDIIAEKTYSFWKSLI